MEKIFEYQGLYYINEKEIDGLKVINNNVSNKLEKLINFAVCKYNETFEIYENKIKLKKH